MKLTIRTIESLAPRAADYTIWDKTVPGLGVRVQPSGRKVFILRYRTTAGVQRKMNIGPAGVLTPDQARDLARDILVQVARGDDPAAKRRAARESETIADLARLYTAARAGHIKPASKAQHARLWRMHILPRMATVRVADVTTAQVARLHAEIGQQHQTTANRCLQLLRASLTYAERIGMRPRHSNPTADIPKFRESKRERILKGDEIAAIFDAVDAYSTRAWAVKPLFKLLLLTGLRRNEWAMAKWDWVDWDGRMLRLPDSKVGPRDVYLSEPVMALLRKLKAASTSEWVIPNTTGKRGIATLHRHWSNICQAAGISGVRVHDLRHTVGSIGHASGMSQRQISDILGHRQMRTTDRYIHSDDGGRRIAAAAASNAILRLVNGGRREG